MNFGMSQREARALLVLADELHFGRAAERLHIAQPQLSHLIKRVERTVGFDIFTRRPSVQLTAGGATLVAGARRADEDLRLGIEEGRAIAAGRKGSVRIGFSDAAMLTDLPTVLKRFSQAAPDVSLHLLEGHSENLLHQLGQGALDLTITRQEADDPSLTCVRLVEDKLVLALPCDHWATAQEKVRLADLSNERLLIFIRRSAAPRYYDRLLRACYVAGFVPPAVQEVDSRAATLALVAAGFGVAFSSAVSQRMGHPGIVFREIADPIDVSFWASYNAGKLSAPARAAVDYIQQALTEA